jgi:TPR repeat protein
MRVLGVILLSLCLVACTTTASKPSALQRGRADFKAGNYHKAFNTLLPLAKQGNAEAEYAVGYFYYYGKGVREDEQQAQYWINQSAQKGYAPAIHALEIEAARKS